MKNKVTFLFFLGWITSLLLGFYMDARGQGTDWQLPTDNYVSAKMDMTVTHPRPEASSWAYSKNAHPGVRWEIPIVIQGGAWPFRYEIVSNDGASGLQIGEELERITENGFEVHRITEEYGVLWWDNPVAGSYDILVRVHDQDGNSIDVPVSLTVGTAGWVFVDPATGDDTNDGSINNPLASIQEIHDRGTNFADHRVYLSGLVPMDGRDENNGNIRVASDTPSPAVWVGMPGTNPVLEAYEGKFVIDNPDFYMANLEHRHHENFVQDSKFIHMFTVWSDTDRLTLHDNHFSRFQGFPVNEGIGNSSIIMFTHFGDSDGRRHVAIVNNRQSGENGIFTSTYQLRYSVIEKNQATDANLSLQDGSIHALFYIKGSSRGGSNEYISIRANEYWDNNQWGSPGNLRGALGILRARNIELAYNTIHTPYTGRGGALKLWTNAAKNDYIWTTDTPVWIYRNSLKQDIGYEGDALQTMEEDNVISEQNILDTGTWPTSSKGYLLNIDNLDGDTYFDSQMKLTGSARTSYLGRYGAEIAVQDGGGGSQDPVASFTFEPSEDIDVGEQIDFTDTSTDSDGSVTSWNWDFGDGATSSDQNPSHSYSQPGDYTVSLTVTDNEGNDSTPSTTLITVLDPGDEPDKVFHVDAQALSADDGDALTDWADQSSEGNNVSGSGTYVEASTINGYPAVRFNGTDDMFETTITETTTEYTLFMVKQVDGETGEYDASFSSNDDLFNDYAFQLDYRKNMMTHASVGTEGGVNDNSVLDIGSRTEDPVILTIRANGTITEGWLTGERAEASVDREFGGFNRFRIGESRSGDNHVKGDIGEVIVYFRSLSDSERAQVEQDLMVKWGFESGSQNPVASFSYTPEQDIEPGQQIDFTDTSTDSDGTVASWVWDFGDGTTSSDQNPSHTYSQPGDYTVSLTVTDNEGNDSSPSTTVITVLDSGDDPDKVFHVDAQSLDASDGEALTAWADLSGQDNSVSGTGTYVEEGINGRPSVRFSGDNGDTFETTFSEQLTEYTVFVVKQIDASSNSFGASFASTAEFNDLQGFQLDTRDESFNHSSRGVDGPDGSLVTLPIGGFTSEPVVLTVRADGEKTQGWLQGVEAGQTTAVPQGHFDRFRLGRNRVGGGYFTGDIGEVLVYFRSLSDSERAQVEQGLMDKWGFDGGEPVDGSDQRVVAGNQDAYVFSSGDFGDTEGQYSVKIQSLPDAGELLGSGEPLTAGTVVTAGQLASGHLSWIPPAGEHGYGFTQLSFSLQEDTNIPPPPPPPGSEPEEPSGEDGQVYTLAIDLAAETVELTGGEGWRFLTIPATGASYADLLGPVWTQGVAGSDDPGAGPASVLVFDQPNFEWIPVGGLDQPAGPGEAFIAYILSDDDGDGSPDGFPKTLTSGQQWAPLDGSFTYSGLDYGEPANPNNVYLVGNPHPVNVDYCAMLDEAADMSTALWVWNPAAGGGQGDYQSLNCATESELPIAPFQSVWVRTAGENPSLGVPAEAYISQTGSGYFKQQDKAKGLDEPEHLALHVASDDEVFTNRVDLLFTPEGELGMDPLDAPKLSPAGLADRWVSFYALDEQGQAYSFRSLPQEFDGQLVIPMNLKTTEQGTFSLSWELPEAGQMSYWLRDTRTGGRIELSEAGRYSFEVEPTEEASSGEDTAPRFELVAALADVGGPGSPAELPDQVRLQQNYPNPFNPATVIGYELPSQSQVRLDVYDIAGRHVATLVDRQVAAGRHQVNFDASELSSGVYLYRLQVLNSASGGAGATIQTQKLTIIK